MQERFDYHDCFNMECRAYGRLQETGNEDLAVPCHGYVLLTSHQEMFFRSQSSKRLAVFHRDESNSGTPLRALLKDWVEEGTGRFEPGMVRKMMRELKSMHSVGIMNRDIKENNYLGGKLFDFGLAWTVPHERVTTLQESVAANDEDAAKSRKELDFELGCDEDSFDLMVDEWNLWNEKKTGFRIWQRFLPNFDYYSALRSWLRPPSSTQSIPRYACHRVDPFMYDWRSASKVSKLGPKRKAGVKVTTQLRRSQRLKKHGPRRG